MSDKDLIKDLWSVLLYISGWILGAFSVAVTLGLFFGVVIKVAKVVSA
jgi:hypothetical protein